MTNWKQGMGKLFLIKLMQKIGLVFSFVFGFHQFYHSPNFLQLCIMTSRKIVKPKLPSLIKPKTKLYKFVAHHIRIWGSSATVFIKHIFDYPFSVFFFKIEC